MTGISWIIRNPEQLANFLQFAGQMPFPFSGKIGPYIHPKTQKQINYMHSLCDALATGNGIGREKAKRDAKVEYGVIQVSTSCITGDRSADLVSFGDYSREQSTGFITAMEAHLDEREIPYTPSEAV